jgi:hypothetical protein
VAVAFGALAVQVRQMEMPLAGLLGDRLRLVLRFGIDHVLVFHDDHMLVVGVNVLMFELGVGPVLVFRLGLAVRVRDMLGILGVFSEFRAFGVLGEFRELSVISVLGELDLLAYGACFVGLAVTRPGLVSLASPVSPASPVGRWILVVHITHCDRLTGSVMHLLDLQCPQRPD